VSDFKGRHFEGEIVLWAVRWYCRYGVSYRDLEQMMSERGVSIDQSQLSRVRGGQKGAGSKGNETRFGFLYTQNKDFPQ
jgi:hypothetical protein